MGQERDSGTESTNSQSNPPLVAKVEREAHDMVFTRNIIIFGKAVIVDDV